MGIYRKLQRLFYKINTKCIYRLSRAGKASLIINPMQIDNPDKISLGKNVTVFDYAWLMGTTEPNEPGLLIDDGTVVGHFSHIIANKSVTIERNVLLADKVFITDCTHEYRDIEQPIQKNKIKCIKNVVIGEGSWLGENVCVCGASIGKHCVIGANSVVTSDIPNYCVAVGSPAHVIKQYDFNCKEWVKK